MTNNDKVKRKISFSVIDFVIIVTVLALIVGIVFRYDLLGKLFSRTEPVDVTVSFVAENITKEEAQVFLSDTDFYLDGKIFGRLQSSESLPHSEYLENSSGTLTQITSEQHVDVSGSFLCKAVYTDGGYLLDGKTYIAAGSSFTLRTDTCSIDILILAVEGKE